MKLFLIVYVDDFKLAGPKTFLKHGWKYISGLIDIEPPAPTTTFLGCASRKYESTVGECIKRLYHVPVALGEPAQAAKVNVLEYSMNDYFS